MSLDGNYRGHDPYPFPLTKTLNPDDEWRFPLTVEGFFNTAGEQHPARKWEYGLALTAIDYWAQKYTRDTPPRAWDVGGANSPFLNMLGNVDVEADIIDPGIGTLPLHEFLQHSWVKPRPLVFCISVLEHVEDLDQFLVDLAKLTEPKGMLFITMDIWDHPTGEADTAHFHWMRSRIFTLETWKAMADRLRQLGFSLLGKADWEYHGDQLFGSYSFASLCMVKEDQQ